MEMEVDKQSAPPDDWQGMLCLETATALDNAIVLPGGGVHPMGTTIRIS